MTWLREFVQNHTGRFPRHDWPPPKTPARKAFFGGWKAAMERARVSQAEAEAASIALQADPPRFLDAHLRALLAKVHEGRRDAARNGGEFTDVETAREACRHCPQCSGNGFTTVDGVAAYCVCGLGQLIKRTHMEKDPKLARRFRQAEREPVMDDAAIDALWDDLTDGQRKMWRDAVAERHPAAARGRGRWAESMARVAAYRAEVRGEDPFECELEVA